MPPTLAKLMVGAPEHDTPAVAPELKTPVAEIAAFVTPATW
jgi:hypothetical protein